MKTHEVKLSAGFTYTIDMVSVEIDSYLILEDEKGNILAEDDDGGGFPNARIVFRAPEDGTYRIIATTFPPNQTGNYTLTVRESSGPVNMPPSKDEVSSAKGREQTALAQFQKANQLRNAERHKEAIAGYRLAIDMQAKLAAEFPDVAGHALLLGGAYCNLGHSLSDTQELEQALAFYEKALAAMEPLLKKDPVPANTRLFLRNTHWGRAKALGQLERYPDATKDWQRVVELDETKLPEFRAGLARSMVHHGALGEAVTSAEALAKTKLSATALYDLACMYGVCTGKVKDDPKVQEKFAQRALQLLDQARHAGWFNHRIRLDSLKNESDLEPLRSRQEFKKLTGELEKAYRYELACLAVRAGEGEQDKAKLRAQALDWLRADLDAHTAQTQAGRIDGMLLAIDKLSHWQNVPDLAAVREPPALGLLPEKEQESWRKLWTDANQVLGQAKASFTTQATEKGALTAQQRQQNHEMKLATGKAYIIDMHSTAFDAYLMLLDGKGKLLAENDDIAPGTLDSRIIFTPKEDGVYRIVATSFQQQGIGAYTLTIREFAGYAK